MVNSRTLYEPHIAPAGDRVVKKPLGLHRSQPRTRFLPEREHDMKCGIDMRRRLHLKHCQNYGSHHDDRCDGKKPEK